MKRINLREYYPFYKADLFVEVPDEVADLLRESVLMEEAYRIRTYRHKAYYSLDYGDNIERKALIVALSPFEIIEERWTTEMIYKGISTLPEKQAQRIYTHFFLGMTKAAIAQAEGCAVTAVKTSIRKGLHNLKKFFEENS